MTGPLAEELLLTLVLIAAGVVVAVMACMYAYRQGRRLRRWNDRYRTRVSRGGSPLRNRTRWSAGGPAWR